MNDIRRNICRLSNLLLLMLFLSLALFPIGYAAPQKMTMAQMKLAKIESDVNGRLGVYAMNVVNHKFIAYRQDERFPLCSTHKLMAVAAFLKKSETQKGLLEKVIKFQKSDLVSWSPVCKSHLKNGMTNSALAQATIVYSDNTAVNLLVHQLGGSIFVTAFSRLIGDTAFRLDRSEPALNSATPGDRRDTTTPRAMAKSIEKIALGEALTVTNRKALNAWLIDSHTGDVRIQAGLPQSAVVGDKTGSCGRYGAIGDVGVIWQKDSAPVVMAIYFTARTVDATPRDDIIASAARISFEALRQARGE